MLRALLVSALLVVALAATRSAQAASPTDTLRTPGGVRYVIHHPGTGKLPSPDGRVQVHYTGFFTSGLYFDTSATDGRPLRVHLGRHEVIPGWEELLPLLPAGARVWAYIPAHLAYGSKGARDPDDELRFRIPPNTDLIFELEIVRVN
jgi:FKBP-type peptidyl-prolyl cis-trans isomerase